MTGWNDIPNIQWYGERGIVNAVVTFISHGDHEGRLERLKKFLKAIKWGNNNEQSWICEILDFKIVVELGLADFGNPDLIIVCKDKDNSRYCIFIEAKVGQYKKSMHSNAKGMENGGFNSSINGQLSLKYRFATALKKDKEDGEQGLSEPKCIYDFYKDKLNDKRRSGPRKIIKPEIIQTILEPLGLKGIDIESCYFVAWTWDNDHHIFFKDTKVKENNGMPLFDDTASDEIEMRLGWLGYKNLEKYLNLDHSNEYMAARKTMIDSSEPSDNNEYYEAKQVTLEKLDEFDGDIRKLSEGIVAVFEGSAGFKTITQKKSYSIRYGNKVVAKIIPQENGIFVGVRSDFDDVTWEKISGDEHEYSVIKTSGVYFKGINIDPSKLTDGMKNVKKFIDEHLDHIDTFGI